MRTTMDRAGRIVVPKAVRERLRLPEGGEVEIVERDGVAEIRPASAQVDVVEFDGDPVVRPREAMPPLTDDVVRDTLEASR